MRRLDHAGDPRRTLDQRLVLDVRSTVDEYGFEGWIAVAVEHVDEERARRGGLCGLDVDGDVRVLAGR